MTARLWIAVIFILAAGNAFAAGYTDPREPKVFELLKLMQVDRSLSKEFITNMTLGNLQTTQAYQQATPENRQKMIANYRKSLDLVDYGKLKLGIVQIYERAYTEEELDALIQFYKSPIGQKVIARQPEVAAASQRVMMEMMQDIRNKTAQQHAAAKK